MITKEELAAKLNGREYTCEITDAEALVAKQSGLIVIFGSSDDLCEFRGALNDETGAYNGTKVLIDRDGQLLEPIERDDEEVLMKYKVFGAAMEQRKAAILIDAKWSHEGYSWFISTEAPHATFDVMEGEEKFCRGIVIDLKDLK